jgi:uncharacterized protein HemY
MNPTAKWLIVGGVALAIVGLLWQVGSKLGLGRLPGDIVVERENFRFSFPIVTCVVLSVVASLVWFVIRRFGR